MKKLLLMLLIFSPSLFGYKITMVNNTDVDIKAYPVYAGEWQEARDGWEIKSKQSIQKETGNCIRGIKFNAKNLGGATIWPTTYEPESTGTAAGTAARCDDFAVAINFKKNEYADHRSKVAGSLEAKAVGMQTK